MLCLDRTTVGRGPLPQGLGDSVVDVADDELGHGGYHPIMMIAMISFRD